jgi:hypothetical protein
LSKNTSSLSGGLLNLAEKLAQMCLNSRADSTRRCYKNAFEKWCKWCVSVKLPSFPATEFHMLFIVNIYTNNYLKLNIILDIATAYPYRLCHYNINKIILGPCPISHFPNMPLCNRVMSISTCSEQSLVMFIYAFLHGHNVAEFGMALISRGMAGIFFEEWHDLSK